MIKRGKPLAVSLKNGGHFRTIIYVAFPFTFFGVHSLVVIIDVNSRFSSVKKDNNYVFLQF